MRQLLNTLFVLSEDAYLSLDGETVAVSRTGQPVRQFPLHTLEGIVSFSYAGASPALMGACARRGVDLCFFLAARSIFGTHRGRGTRQRAAAANPVPHGR